MDIINNFPAENKHFTASMSKCANHGYNSGDTVVTKSTIFFTETSTETFKKS